MDYAHLIPTAGRRPVTIAKRLSVLPLAIFSRRRPLAAACLSLLSFVMLWTGFGVSELLTLPGIAVAESTRMDYRSAPKAVAPERAALLQSSVDSVALSLGSALSTLSEERERKAALGNALSSLTFELGGEAYFTAWHGTRIIHSPLTPDTAGMDFAQALDERGSAFVLTMEAVAETGGGFVRVTLPLQLPQRIPAGFAAGGEAVRTPLHLPEALPAESRDSLSANIQAASKDTVAVGKPVHSLRYSLAPSNTPTPENPLVAEYASEAAPPALADTAPLSVTANAAAVDQVVYIRNIPQSDWHIAAFMPTKASPGFEGQGFSPAWSAAAADKSAALAAENDLRNGLCVSGFSLAGLAGLMMAPVRSRREDEQAIAL